jgi:alpha-ribazole phosphatase
MHSLDDSLVVAILRHGLTFENQQKKYIGWSDPSLSNIGREELRKIKENYNMDYDFVLCSDLKRSVETATILFPSTKIVTCTLWREMHFGDWEGMGYEELKDDLHYRKWVNDPYLSPPQGESLDLLQKRMETAWKELRSLVKEQQAKRVAVITHGGAIRTLLSNVVPLNQRKSFWEWDIPYGKGYELTWKSRKDWEEEKPCTL